MGTDPGYDGKEDSLFPVNRSAQETKFKVSGLPGKSTVLGAKRISDRFY